MSVSVTVSKIFSVDLEIWVRGRSKSFKMAPFDRLYTTLHYSAIVGVAVSCTIF